MKNIYTAGVLAVGLAFSGCAQNAYVPKDMAERSKGPGTVVCTPMKGLVDDKGFACADAEGNAMRIHPDKRVWKGSYEETRGILQRMSEEGTSVSATGEYDTKTSILDADLVDLGANGMLVTGRLYPTHTGTLDTLVDGEPRVVSCTPIAGLVTEDNFACRDTNGTQRTFVPATSKLKLFDKTFEKQRGAFRTDIPGRYAIAYDAKDNVVRVYAYEQDGKTLVLR